MAIQAVSIAHIGQGRLDRLAPLWVALTTLAVLTCVLVLGHLSEVRYRRAAEKRALILLKQWLSLLARQDHYKK